VYLLATVAFLGATVQPPEAVDLLGNPQQEVMKARTLVWPSRLSAKKQVVLVPALAPDGMRRREEDSGTSVDTGAVRVAGHGLCLSQFVTELRRQASTPSDPAPDRDPRLHSNRYHCSSLPLARQQLFFQQLKTNRAVERLEWYPEMSPGAGELAATSGGGSCDLRALAGRGDAP